MTTHFSDLIHLITGLNASDDKIMFAICGCFIFLVIISCFINLIKSLMGVWR